MEALETSLSTWKEFQESVAYKEFIKEIQARKDLIIPKLLAGNDKIWTDEEMRGRLDELEFVLKLVPDIIDSLQLEEDAQGKEDNSFMANFFKNMKEVF